METDTAARNTRPGALVGLKTGEADESGVLHYHDPPLLVGGGLTLLFCGTWGLHRVSPAAIVAMILFLGDGYWLSRRSGRRENPDRT